MTNHHFPKPARLLRSSEFDQVFAVRTSAANDSLIVYGAENTLGRPRLGLVVSRRYGPAVARNRWKRVAREAFRTTQQDLPALDLICLPRGDAAPDFAQMVASLNDLAARIEEKLRKRRQRTPGEGGPRRTAP